MKQNIFNNKLIQTRSIIARACISLEKTLVVIFGLFIVFLAKITKFIATNLLKISPQKQQSIQYRIHKRFLIIRCSKVSKYVPTAIRKRPLTNGVFLSIIVFVVTAIVLQASMPMVSATLNIDTNAIKAGNYDYNNINLANGGSQIELQKGNLGSWDGDDRLEALPIYSYGDFEITAGPNKSIYYLTTTNQQCKIINYDPENRKYTSVTPPPIGCGDGLGLAYDGFSKLYMVPGANQSWIMIYDIVEDTWEKVAIPMNISAGSAIAYVRQGASQYVYMFRGGQSSSFWKYDTSTKQIVSVSAFQAAADVNYGMELAWDGADTLYAISQYRGEFKKYSIASNTWTNISTVLGNQYYKHSFIFANGVLYDLRLQYSTNLISIYSYIPGTGSWNQLQVPPMPPHYYDWRLGFAYDGSGYLYSAMGSYTSQQLYRFNLQSQSWESKTTFTNWNHYYPMYDGSQTVYYLGGYSNIDYVYKYDIGTGETTTVGLQDTMSTQSGYAGVYKDNLLYTVPTPGSASTLFQKFDLTSKEWVSLSSLPFVSNAGSAMVDGNDGYLYTTFGARSSFYRYQISTNTWSSLASIPEAVGSGAGMTRIGQTIYVSVANGSSNVYKYNMLTNAWTVVRGIPIGYMTNGSFMTGDGSRYLYLGVSNYYAQAGSKMMYRYDTVADSWRRMSDMPANTFAGADAYYDLVNNKLSVWQGQSYSRVWDYSLTNDAYVKNGSWCSGTLDLKNVSAWQGLTYDTTGAGAVVASVRTSNDGKFWSDWVENSGNTVNAAVNIRYAQIKISLSSDGNTTPSVSNLSIDYSQEASPPSLPSQLTVKENKDSSTSLVSGQTYEYQHPYISWSGADDGATGSGIEGYYVYFGVDSGADPQTLGSYQTTSNYTVDTAMTAGEIYYIRLKAVDKLGNVSPAGTFFSYRYWYISPPASIVKTSDSDFGEGINMNMDINNGTMQLQRQSTGAWGIGSMPSLPDSSQYGASSVVAGDYLYVMRGYTSTTFWRLNLITNRWETLSVVPAAVGSGSGLVWDGGKYLYAIRGLNVANGFYRYDIENNAWSTLTNLPGNAQSGTDMEFIGNGRIAIFFTSTKEFYFYNIATGQFTPRETVTIPVSTVGVGMWYDGNDTIYTNVGFYDYSQINRSALWKYTISTDSWKDVSISPILPYIFQNNLVSDGRGNLYMFSNDFLVNVSTDSRAVRYNIAEDKWYPIKNFNAQAYNGTAASDGKRYVYIIPGAAALTTRLIRYDTWEGTFVPANPTIASWDRYFGLSGNTGSAWIQGTATTAVYDGQGSVYAIGADGGTFSRFIKFNPKTGDTEYLPPPPYAGTTGSLSYDTINKKLYYFIASSSKRFYEYNFIEKQWIQLADYPVNAIESGSQSLVSLNDGGLLAFTGRVANMYKFTPDVNGGSWAAKASAPGVIRGGAAIYDPANNLVYVIAGNNSTNFYRYDVAANTWATMAVLPGTAYWGATGVLKDGKIYATRGNSTADMYVYTIATNTWVAGPTAPELFKTGAALVPINNEQLLAFSGDNSADPWTFSIPSSSTAYEGSASHISPVMTLAGIFDYAGIKAEVNEPTGTKVEFWTKTSSDGVNWEDWKIADRTKKFAGKSVYHVTSTPQVQTQIKVVLRSDDNLYTPSVGSFALDYYFDVDPPNNPSAVDAYSDNTKSTPISTNTWYNHPSINLDWPDPGETGGASDGPLGSRIKGYYVYFGTDPTAVPRTAGTFVTQSEFTPNLTQPGVYYFRLQAQDQTGNVDPNIYAGFMYKFDNELPNAPSLITITPSGFTAINKYSIEWPASFDAHSGVKEYCWHTGDTSGPYSTDTCQTGRSLTDLDLAYTQGTNVFYVRVQDKAGNYSQGYITASYYYSTESPGPVNGLRAVPPVSPQNLFAFAWDLPSLYSGDPSQLQYCYSINVFPSPLNTTCVPDKFIAPFKAATKQGTNIIYIITKDEAGNANWNSYASANFVANTVSPGIPLNVTPKDTSDRRTDRWSVTLTWDQPSFTGNGIASYIVERSLDGHTFVLNGSTSTRAFVDLDVVANTTYYYRIRAADGVDNRGGASGIVTMVPKGSYSEPPNIVVQPKAQVGFDQATVTWATDRPSTSFVYYGVSPSGLNQSKGSLEVVSEHSVTISGLTPSTTYYYRVQSFDEDHSYDLAEATSSLYTLRTTETARIYSVNVDAVTLNSGVINWRTSVPTNSTIEYGTTLSYGLSQNGDGVGYATNNILKLTGLENGTTYHYRINAKTEFGSTIRSDDYTFNTIPRPIISNIAFQPIADAATISARVTWTTNVPTSTTLRYSGLGAQKEISTGELVTSHSVEISDLAGSTDYSFTLEGRDQYGNLASSSQQKWQSSVDTRPPTISGFSVSTTALQNSGGAKAQLIITWKTDEPATTQVSYARRNDKKSKPKLTALDNEPTNIHTVIITNLNLADIYTLQPISRDLNSNSTYGTKSAIVTPDKETSVLDTVLNVLQKVFWF